MDYLSICVPSLAILVSAVLVLSCGQTDRQTHKQNHRITEVDDRYTHATTVGVSNNSNNINKNNFKMSIKFKDQESKSRI